jgi:ubiquinone/menaquinone biosynthesis C-methylase UbiE
MIDPKLLLEKIKLAPGMHVADFGSGKTGNFIFPAAAIVGENGSAYAVDIIKESLAGLAKRAALDNLPNFHTIWADVERPGAVAIPPATLDAVFLINFVSAIKKRDAVLGEANRLLKPGGNMLLVDWKNRILPFAPPPEDMVSADAIKPWASANGYTVEKSFDADKYHWGLVLRKGE